mgnify:FL=1
MLITSLDNERVKKYRKLREKKYRDRLNLFLVEGWHLVLEAYRAGLVEEVILTEEVTCELDVPKIYVTQEIIKKITELDTPVPILALCHKVENDPQKIGQRILMLDGIQDPGNLGTILRSAKAFHVDTVILGTKTVDLYNAKVLRATQGMLFHLHVIEGDLVELIPKIKKQGIPIYGTKVESGEDVRKLETSAKTQYALVMGNEGNGVTEEVLSLCDHYLYIQMDSEVESLNVAVATSILLYELDRREN